MTTKIIGIIPVEARSTVRCPHGNPNHLSRKDGTGTTVCHDQSAPREAAAPEEQGLLTQLTDDEKSRWLTSGEGEHDLTPGEGGFLPVQTTQGEGVDEAQAELLRLETEFLASEGQNQDK